MFLERIESLLLIMVVFIPLERLFALHREQRLFRRLWQLDTIYLLLNPTLIGLGIKGVLILLLLLTSWLVPPELQAWVGSQPFWMQFPVLLILADLGFYCAHRTFHSVPWLWKFHAVHHSIEEMDWLAAHRVHPIDQIMTKAASILPIFVLGFSAGPIAAFGLLYQWQSLFIHSNVKIEFGPLSWILATPRFHHWHHADHPEAYNRNFAGQLPFLDALFGTMHMPAAEMPARYGSDTPVPQNYGAQLLFPFRQAAKPPGTLPPQIAAPSGKPDGSLLPG